MNAELKKALNKITKSNPLIVRPVTTSTLIKRIKLDSPQLSFLFSGGLPIGRIHNFFGMESQGKSTIVTYLASQLQKYMPEDQRVVIYLDYERSFDTQFAQTLGLDVSEDYFIYLRPDSLEEGIDVVSELIPTKTIAAIILDSDAAAPTKTQMIDEFGKSTYGSLARVLAEGLRKLNILCSNYDTTFFTISQERANMNVMSHQNNQTGGFSSKFFPTTRNRIKRNDYIKEGNETIGIQVTVQNYKNKGGIPYRHADMNLYFGNGSNGIKGFNANEEYVDFLVNLGIVQQKGSYFKNEEFGFNLQGRVKLQAWLNEHEDIFSKMKEQVDTSLTKYTELDANNESDEDFDRSFIDEEVVDDTTEGEE